MVQSSQRTVRRTVLSLKTILRGTGAYQQDRVWRCGRCGSSLYADAYSSKTGYTWYVAWTCWATGHVMVERRFQGSMVPGKFPISKQVKVSMEVKNTQEKRTLGGLTLIRHSQTYPPTPGCDQRCVLLTYQEPGQQEQRFTILHCPQAHEEFAAATSTLRADPVWITGGGLRMMTDASTVSVDGQETKLTATERQILAVLAQNVNRLVPGEMLLRLVFKIQLEQGNKMYAENTHLLRVHMARLRKALDSNNSRRFIKTTAGVGYTLMVEQADGLE